MKVLWTDKEVSISLKESLPVIWASIRTKRRLYQEKLFLYLSNLCCPIKASNFFQGIKSKSSLKIVRECLYILMPYDIKICLFLLYKDLCCPINSIYRKIRANHTDFPVIDFFYLDSSEKWWKNFTFLFLFFYWWLCRYQHLQIGLVIQMIL